MAVTRSTRALLSTTVAVKKQKISKTIETVAVPAAAKVSKVTEVTEVKTTKSPKKTKKSIAYVEDVLSHIKDPISDTLPAEFEQFHEPEFVKGVKSVLKVDPSLYRAFVCQNFPAFARDNTSVRQVKNEPVDEKEVLRTYWFSLIVSVIGQQISGMAAKSIREKFVRLFKDKPTPSETLKLSETELRLAGLSNMKTKYVRSISEAFGDDSSNLSRASFYTSSTTLEIVDELVKLKGVGPWSAKMFCLFTLKELDVFAEDDLGVARGVSRYLDKRPHILAEIKKEVQNNEESKKKLKKKGKFDKPDSKRDWTPLHDEYIKQLGLRFLPYQLCFMLVTWRLSSTNVEVFAY